MRTCDQSSPSSSARICASPDCAPCPISVAFISNVRLPSTSMRIQPAMISLTLPSAARSGTRISTSRMPPATAAECRKARRDSLVDIARDLRSVATVAEAVSTSLRRVRRTARRRRSAARNPRDQLHFDNPVRSEQAGSSDRRPCGIWRLHVVAGDFLEQRELLALRAFEVGPLPDVEAVDHHDVRETCTRRFEQPLEALKAAVDLQLEGRRILALAFAPADDDAGDVEHVVHAANCGVAHLVV